MIKTLDQIKVSDQKIAGGKSLALARLHQNGFPVPHAVCLTTEAYESFIAASGLQTRIQIEINRKDFSQMRWEEIWDAALRIRNLFLKTPMPAKMNAQLRQALEPLFENAAVAVRSSAPGEDARGSSFAGLHESFVNIRGIDAIIDHVRLVWASLWSDAAMLYRKEIGLNVNHSKMAVIIQEMIDGDRSGVIFTRNPANAAESVLESVHGLNQGLVDGVIAPDRWTLDMQTGTVLSHVPAERVSWMIAGTTGAAVSDLPPEKKENPPLDEEDIRRVFEQAMAAENLFDYPQDMEWTFQGDHLSVLQSRPISTGAGRDGEDDRGWYLSLRRSLANLKNLRMRIEEDLVVKMIADADALAGEEISSLTDRELADEIERRKGILAHWKKIYWDEFIPFAHGMRLFGQFYTDTVRPEDPYEFVRLLETSDLQSISRNRQLEELAVQVRRNPDLQKQLETGHTSETDSEFIQKAKAFFHQYMEAEFTGPGGKEGLPDILVSIIVQTAQADPKSKPRRTRQELEVGFLGRFDGDSRQNAEDLLDLARASYRMRDDDNMFIGRIEREAKRSVEEAKQRLGVDIYESDALEISKEIIKSLREPGYQMDFKQAAVEKKQSAPEITARQLIGQPAGRGLGSGPARVIAAKNEIGEFRHGEVLVCDAIDPNMTLIVPMAAAIVERRGGMLIHGAIIAREYGIPCVTGVPDATRAIDTGDRLTVDGFLGIVTVSRPDKDGQ